jgi:hypothetical protein
MGFEGVDPDNFGTYQNGTTYLAKFIAYIWQIWSYGIMIWHQISPLTKPATNGIWRGGSWNLTILGVIRKDLQIYFWYMAKLIVYIWQIWTYGILIWHQISPLIKPATNGFSRGVSWNFTNLPHSRMELQILRWYLAKFIAYIWQIWTSGILTWHQISDISINKANY